MRLAIIAGALTLAGCATVGETMATKDPSGVYVTAKTPAAYRDCIVQSEPYSTYSVTEHEGGFMFVSTKVPGNVFTVKSAVEGSEVSVWGLMGTRRTARGCL